jgi:hypothetical protein
MEEKMFKSITETAWVAVTLMMSALGTNALLAALIVAGASSLVPSSAHAELKPLFNKLLLYNSPETLPTIEVEAEGQEWARVSSGTLHVTTNYYVSLNKGDITTITAFVGFVRLTRMPGGGKERWGEFSFEIPGGNLGFAITACNKEKQSGANTGETHTTYAQVPALLRVSAKRAGNSATREADGNVQARIVCKRAPKLVEIRSFAVEVDPSTDKCPKNAVVRVSFNTNSDDRIDFALDHRNAGSLSTSEHSAQPFTIGGQYVAQKQIDLVVDNNTEYVEARLKDGSDSRRWRTTGPAGTPINCPRAFKVTSLWLTYDVENKDTCPKKVVEKVTGKATAPGKLPFEVKTQSGLVVHSGAADFRLKGMEYVAEFGRDNLVFSNAFESDMMALIKDQPAANSGWVKLKVDCLQALSGKLMLNSLGDTSCKGEALVAIHSNGTGELPYELECGPGKSWQRKVTARANKIGVDKVRFDVTNNEQVTCALRTRIGGVVKPLDGASMTFQCHKPTGVSDVDEFVPETRPDPQAPAKPGKIVIDPLKPDAPEPDMPSTAVVDPLRPTISCAGGTVKNGACQCERTMKPVKAGKNAWRCVVDAEPEKPTVSEPKISCAGGRVVNGACTCARTHKPVKSGQNAWRCVKTVVIDPPRNKDSANKANKFEVKTAPKTTGQPKLGNADKAKGGKGKGNGKTAKKGNGSSALR